MKQRSVLIPKKVQFFEPTLRDIAIRRSGLDKLDLLDDVYNKLFDLSRLTKEIERRIPMLSYKPVDELDQLKFYIQTYYQPCMPYYSDHALNDVNDTSFFQ